MASDEKICLFLRPFADPGSEIQAETEKLHREIIQPALQTKGISLRVQIIDTIAAAGSISVKIVETLYSAYLVIADLTYLTPNTMFEIGYRLALNLPLIAIVRKDGLDTLPFDVKTLDVVAYSLDTQEDRKSAIRNVRKRVRNILKGEQKNTIFSKTLKDVEKRLATTSVYLSFIESLRQARRAVDAGKAELLFETDFCVEKLREHHIMSNRIFTALSDKLYVYTQIARGVSMEYTDSGLLQLIALAGKAVGMGDRIERCFLGVARRVEKKAGKESASIIKACYTEVVSILDGADEVLSRVMTETQGLVQPRKETEQVVDFSEVLQFLTTQGYQLTNIWGSYRVFTKESLAALPLLVPVKGSKVSEDYFRFLRKKVEDVIE